MRRPVIFCDFDDVIGDFRGAAAAVHGFESRDVTYKWDFWADWGLTKEQFWAPIRELGPEFYGHVSCTPWAWELWDVLMNQPFEVKILSASPDHPEGFTGKRLWCDRYLAASRHRNAPPYKGDSPDVMIARDKYTVARPHTLLIDDGEHNVEAFRAAGGQAITWPAAWNNMRHLADNPLEYVKTELELELPCLTRKTPTQKMLSA